MIGACDGQPDWPARVTAGIYAGVDFAVANPAVVELPAPHGYEDLIRDMAACIRKGAPTDERRAGSTDEALVAGIVDLVGDHVRRGRVDRLAALRPELVLMILLPYLGFTEAQRWVNEIDGVSPT